MRRPHPSRSARRRPRVRAARTRRARTSTRESPHRSRLRLQLAHERHDRLLERLRRDRSDLLVANHALLVDDERLGHTVDAPVDPDTAIAIDDRRRVRVAVLREPALAGDRLVLVIEADDRDDLLLA